MKTLGFYSLNNYITHASREVFRFFGTRYNDRTEQTENVEAICIYSDGDVSHLMSLSMNPIAIINLEFGHVCSVHTGLI